MILADKIIDLRKRAGYSQEELAEQLGVSRQSISKWEGAQSIPDMNKILAMANLFGVSTDYLLRDEMEAPEGASVDSGTEEGLETVRVSMETARAYIEAKKAAAPKIAFGVLLCIFSPIMLILLGGLQEYGKIAVSENLAGGLGLIILMAM
ncbi:MAG: helix-turn-helix transcriptional regulator, partial [Firmicutes bacterium]|nr:helix-turn-helix transcriptional regulator [Bacillota bacterium]